MTDNRTVEIFLLPGVSKAILIMPLLLRPIIIILAVLVGFVQALIFLILTQNKYITGLTISWFSIFVLFWYHRIYVERFADNYFTQTHYEKR